MCSQVNNGLLRATLLSHICTLYEAVLHVFVWLIVGDKNGLWCALSNRVVSSTCEQPTMKEMEELLEQVDIAARRHKRF